MKGQSNPLKALELRITVAKKRATREEAWNGNARLQLGQLLARKARLLWVQGHKEAASQLLEELRGFWKHPGEELRLDSEYLHWRWVESTRSALDLGVLNLKVDWDQLSCCYAERATELPFLLRALAGKELKLAFLAFKLLCAAIYHQGTTYTATPVVRKAIRKMLKEHLIPLGRVRTKLLAPWKLS